MASASVEVREKSVMYGGKEYATLDFTPPRDTREGGQGDTFSEVPAGWVLAEKSEGVVEQVVARFPWGTYRIVFGNGDVYQTSGNNNPGSLVFRNHLVQDGHGCKPKDASACRVLICADEVCAEPAAAGDHCTQALTRLWESRQFPDCEVVCNGHVFECHRAVLAQASPVFNQMLSGEMLEAKLQRIQLEALEAETEAVSAFLAFVYTGKLDCKSEHFPTVVKLADFYQLDCITAKTCNDMLQALDAGNVVPMTRLVKSVRNKPRVGPYWAKLRKKVLQSEELADAVLLEV